MIGGGGFSALMTCVSWVVLNSQNIIQILIKITILLTWYLYKSRVINTITNIDIDIKNNIKAIIACLGLIFASAVLADCYVIKDSDGKIIVWRNLKIKVAIVM